MEKMGIKNLKEMIDFMLVGVDVGMLVAKDGKLDISDAMLLMKFVPVVGPAFEELNQIAPEALDIDSEEGVELIAHVAAKLALDNEKAKAIVLESIKFMLAGMNLFKAVKG